jgi:hypothetical protein
VSRPTLRPTQPLQWVPGIKRGRGVTLTTHHLVPSSRMGRSYIVRFQVLTAASMMFIAVFWVVLPCKMIVDRRFRGTCCLHHQGWRQLWTGVIYIFSPLVACMAVAGRLFNYAQLVSPYVTRRFITVLMRACHLTLSHTNSMHGAKPSFNALILAVRSSETSVTIYQTARRNTPEDSRLWHSPTHTSVIQIVSLLCDTSTV